MFEQKSQNDKLDQAIDLLDSTLTRGQYYKTFLIT
jgi:hypothetical protein